MRKIHPVKIQSICTSFTRADVKSGICRLACRLSTIPQQANTQHPASHTSIMSLRLSSSSSLTLLYDAVRPHHLLGLYAVVRLTSSTMLAQRLANFLLTKLSALSDHCIPLIYKNIVPDFLIRYGIRIQLRHRLLELRHEDVEQELIAKQATVQQLSHMPIAVQTVAANEQHYEVPAAFYDLCLGPAKKYSSGLWPTATTTFAESEQHMLQLYCERAQVQDGMSIVDLGCGWGSLTLYLAQHYPACQITGISNSHSQREYILNTAKARGLNVQNITIVTVRTSLLQEQVRAAGAIC